MAFSCGKVFGFFDIVAAAFVILSGLFWLIYTISIGFYVSMLIIAIVLMAVGVVMIMVAFKTVPWVETYCKFYLTLLGRGIFLIVIGAFNWSSFGVGWLGPLVCWVLGVAYLIAHFVKAVPRPEPLCGGSAAVSAA